MSHLLPVGIHNEKKNSRQKKYLNQFLEELEIRRSVHTLSAYKRDLKLYTQFLNNLDNKPDISLFYEYIDKQGLSPRSKARVISSMRTYFRFLESKGESTALRKLEPLPIGKTLPNFISQKEFQKLYQSASVKETHKAARNHITLLLLFGLGCRISEIVQLNLQDINDLDYSIIVTGKRQKQRMLPLTQNLFTNLSHYIQKHRPLLLTMGKTPSVLINNRGKRPSRVDVWRWLSAWSKKAGFKTVKSPHQFRHGFATSLLEKGVDLRSIQFLLGHSSIQSTQIYTSVKQKHLKKTIKEHHPLSSPGLHEEYLISNKYK